MSRPGQTRPGHVSKQLKMKKSQRNNITTFCHNIIVQINPSRGTILSMSYQIQNYIYDSTWTMPTPGQKNITIFQKYLFTSSLHKINERQPYASRFRVDLGTWNLFYSKCELPWKDLIMDLMSQPKNYNT